MQEPSIIVNIPETNSKNYPIYINNDKISNLKKELELQNKNKVISDLTVKAERLTVEVEKLMKQNERLIKQNDEF